MASPIKAPFTYFGGKSRIADEVWVRLGDIPNYCEPFCGSCAVLLSRPTPPNREVINDMDAYLTNFWRAVQAEPDAVAAILDWPVNEIDKEARHMWLVESVRKAKFVEAMKSDPEYYNVKMAGWWCWGINLWIGSGWCDGEYIEGDTKHAVQIPVACSRSIHSIHRQVPNNKASIFKNSQSTHSIHKKIPNSGRSIFTGMGTHKISRDVCKITGKETGFQQEWMLQLAARLKSVVVCCGDWKRILTPSYTFQQGAITGVFLDPPYSDRASTCKVYTHQDFNLAHEVQQWAVQNGTDKRFRIALCGYEGEYEMPTTWEKLKWKAQGGFSNSDGENKNAFREVIYFSPHCLKSNRPCFNIA